MPKPINPKSQNLKFLKLQTLKFLMSELQNDMETMGRYLSASQSEQLYNQGLGPPLKEL